MSGSVSKKFRLASDILSCVLLINCQKSGYPTGWEFSHIQIFCKNSSWEIPTALAMHHSVTRLWPITISRTLVTISGVDTVRGPSEWGSTSRLPLPCLNSVSHLFLWSDILPQCCYNNSMNSLRCWSRFIQILITLCSAILSILQNSCVLFTITCYHFDICWPNNMGCWLHNCKKVK